MKHRIWLVAAIVAIFGGIGAFWLASRHLRSNSSAPVAAPAAKGLTADECRHAPDSDWKVFTGLDYQPSKTSYTVEWQFCSEDLGGQRIRILDWHIHKVLFEYIDDGLI